MRIVRYFFVGGVAAAVDIGIFTVAVKGFGFDWFFVALVSFLLATAVNYLLSIRYVFKSGVRFKKQAEVSLVFLVSGIGLVINQSVLWLLIETAGIDEVLSKLMATGTVFLWNYMARSRFIFKALQ
jgi:putative flippase GtrA